MDPGPHQQQSVETLLQQAIAHHHGGRLQQAEQLYRFILQSHPYLAPANHNLGIIACQLGQYRNGLPFLKAALDAEPLREQYAQAYIEALLAAGQASDALKTLEAPAVGLGPVLAQSLRAKIVSALQAREDVPASDMQRLAALFQAGRHAEMEAAAQHLVERHPQSGFAWKALGAALQSQGRDSLHALQRAAALLPNDAESFCNLGNVLRDFGREPEAVQHYQRALSINPQLAAAYCGLGAAQRVLGQVDEAIANYRQALDIDPDFAMAHSNLGNALCDKMLHEDAVLHLRRALELKPDYIAAYSNLVMALQFVPGIGREELSAAHRGFGERFEPALKPLWPRHANDRTPDRRLRIGYVSGDFRLHPVTYFIEPAIAHRDRGQVEVFCYANSVKRDAFTERLMAEADHWLPCASLSDEQLSQRILADGIDILVDLSGHTALNRLPVFARKPAPVQITYLGYPGSSGLSAMDYRLTDRYTEPEEGDADRFYTESLVRLPDSLWCYRPSEDMPEVTPLPALANGYLTFGSFNNVNKVNNDCVALWAALLRRIPSARLLMATVPEGELRTRLLGQFAGHGVAAERIAFCGKLPAHEFQRKLQEVDMTLDPFPVNGATTTCESLWLGVPVLALVGQRFLSRAGLSVLSAAGLPEFAAGSEDDFLRIASSWADDLPRLAALRASMRDKLRSSPLFDQPRFARNLEQTFRSLWRRHLAS